MLAKCVQANNPHSKSDPFSKASISLCQAARRSCEIASRRRLLAPAGRPDCCSYLLRSRRGVLALGSRSRRMWVRGAKRVGCSCSGCWMPDFYSVNTTSHPTQPNPTLASSGCVLCNRLTDAAEAKRVFGDGRVCRWCNFK